IRRAVTAEGSREQVRFRLHEGAGHAFDNPHPALHHAEAAAAAWQQTTGILAQTLPPRPRGRPAPRPEFGITPAPHETRTIPNSYHRIVGQSGRRGHRTMDRGVIPAHSVFVAPGRPVATAVRDISRGQKRLLRRMNHLPPRCRRAKMDHRVGVRERTARRTAPIRARPPPPHEGEPVTPVITADGLYKVFGRRPQRGVDALEKGSTRAELREDGLTAAVIDASFSVEPGENFVVMG